MKTGRLISHRMIYLVPVILLLSVSMLFPPHAEARRKPLTMSKDVKGITFDEFWSKVKEEGTKWAGSRLRIRKITSVHVQGFDGHSGLSPVWEAQLVRCDITRGQDAAEEGTDSGGTCKGRSVTIRMVESGVIGDDEGMRISKETHFRGTVIRTDRITVGAQRAEEAANSYKQYNPTDTDNYTYELKFDQRGAGAVWVIKRTCGYKGRSEGRCRPGDHWIVKVNAESGEIVK